MEQDQIKILIDTIKSIQKDIFFVRTMLADSVEYDSYDQDEMQQVYDATVKIDNKVDEILATLNKR